jgi:large subunit ribosomal protein L25
MEAVLEAVKRSTRGKNEANRTRRRGRIPAVVYGTQKDGDTPSTIPVDVDPKPFMRIIRSTSGLNTLITLKVAGESDARVLVKAVLMDPVTHHPLHADFYRVNMDRRIKVTVPVAIRGEARGVKVDGGALDFVQREIEIETLPGEIPNAIEVDVSDLGIGDAVYLRQVAENVAWKPVTDPAQMLVHVVTIKVVEEPAPGAATEATAAAPSEPEVIKKGKAEKEGEEPAAAAAGKAEKAAEKKK